MRLILALILAAAPAMSHEVTTGSLMIDHPYALETAATAMSGAGYMTITNTGPDPDRLLAVRADFPRVTLHGTVTDAQGVARTVEADGIGIAPGQTVTLAPGGLHVMFMGLDGDPFQEGDRIPATLVFDRAGEIAVEFWVEPRDGGRTGHEDHEGHDEGRLNPAEEPAAPPIRAAMQDVLGAGATLGPVAVAGDAAVAPWQAGGEAGRAFLRHGPEGWRIIVLSGESLRLAASYRGLGLSPRAAADLAAQVAVVERLLPAARRAAHDSFAGTLFLPEG